MSAPQTPSADEKSEFLLSCRYGELDDVRQFVDTYGARTALLDVHDDNGNTPLHMVAGNGHEGELCIFSLRAARAFPLSTYIDCTWSNSL